MSESFIKILSTFILIITVVINSFGNFIGVGDIIPTEPNKGSEISTTINHDLTEEEIKEKLDSLLSERNYDPEINESIKDAFKILEENYDYTYKIYKDFGIKTKKEFMLHLLACLESIITDIKFADINDNGQYYAKSRKILLRNGLTKEAGLASTIVHEITHSQQHKIVEQEDTLKDGIYKILTEGEATSTSGLLTSGINFVTSARIKFDNEAVCSFQSFSGSDDYQMYSRYYSMLCIIAGFDTLEDIKRNGYAENKLIRNIEAVYNIDAKKFIDNINIISENMINETVPDINKIFETEIMFVNCLKQIAEKAQTKAEVHDALQIYRDYKCQFAFRYHIGNDDKTNEILDLDSIENILFAKAKMHKLFPKGFEEEVFNVLMFHAKERYNSVTTRIMDDILYCVVNDNIVFTGRNTRESRIYNPQNNTLLFYEFNEEIYNSSSSVIVMQ